MVASLRPKRWISGGPPSYLHLIYQSGLCKIQTEPGEWQQIITSLTEECPQSRLLCQVCYLCYSRSAHIHVHDMWPMIWQIDSFSMAIKRIRNNLHSFGAQNSIHL